MLRPHDGSYSALEARFQGGGLQNCFTGLPKVRHNIRMKTLRYLLLAALVGSVFSCTTKKSDEAAAGSCPFPSNGYARVSSYGNFMTSTLDQCEQYDDSDNPYWTGMDTSTSSTAMVALPTVAFNGGAACGSCLQIAGASATIVARVIAECSSCANDVVDMDEDHYRTVTGFPNSGSGYGTITVTAVPSPVTENIKVIMNNGTNPFYFNIVLANHKTPLKKVEVDIGQGSGYQEYARMGTTGAFALMLGTSSTTPVQIRLTDQFDQVVSGTFTSASGDQTTIGSQFGTCN